MEYTLSHHGVQGQKWGIQNGPPYPLSNEQISTSERNAGTKVSESGKERYGKDGVASNPNSKSHEGLKAVDSSKVTNETKASLIKNAKDMTNSELQSAINRMNSENQLKQLLAEESIAKPKRSEIAAKSMDLARNTTSLAASVSRLTGNQERGDQLGSISKLIGEGKKSYEGIQNLRNKSYQNKIEKFKSETDLSKMSDSEIRETINRINLERTYNSLVARGEQINSGKAKVEHVLDVANVATGLGASATGIASEIKRMGNRSSSSSNNKSETKSNNESNSNKAETKSNSNSKKSETKSKEPNTKTNKESQKEKTSKKTNSKSAAEDRTVYEGTVEGKGFQTYKGSTSSNTTKNGKKFYDSVINGEWHEVNESTSIVPVHVATTGSEFVENTLRYLRG